MPAPWVAGAQGRIVGEIHGQQCVNVMHFATNDQIADEGALDTILLQLAVALAACAVETLLDAVSVDYKFLFADARRIYPAVSDAVIDTAGANSVGALGTTNVSFASSLIAIRTGGGGRRGRGRIFLPPPGDINMVNSRLDNPTEVALAQFLACLAGKFLGANPTTAWRLGVYSKTNDNELGGTFDNSFRIATQLSPVNVVAKMGRRKIGVGS